MLSQGGLNPVDVIAAKIQSRIAIFLTLKETLIGLINQGSVSVSSNATELYTVQGVLESRLNKALADIDKFKSGAWTLSDVATLTMFYTDMEKHIKNVHNLEKESGITITPGGLMPQDAAKYIPWLIGLGIAGTIAIVLMRRR